MKIVFIGASVFGLKCLKVCLVYDFIRAQTKPYPGAYFYLKKNKITVWASKICDLSGVPGTLKIKKNKVIVFCAYKTAVELTDISFNDVIMTIEEFIAGRYV